MNKPETFTIDIPVPVSAELAGDILVTAFDGTYGGCWYWARSGDKDWPERDEDGNWSAVYINFDASDSPTVFMKAFYREAMKVGGVKVGYEEIVSGLSRIINEEQYPQHMRETLMGAVFESDGGMIDANLADCIVQEAIFGKQVYA